MNVDGRRRRYVPLDTLVAFKPFGTRLAEKWGLEGIGAWALLLAAAKREPVEGTFTFTSEAEAWSKMGVSGASFSFSEFITFCGRAKQTRKTCSGRVTYVQLTGWNGWNTRPGNQQNPRSEQENTEGLRENTNELREDAKKYDGDTTPETETETEAEEEVEEQAVQPGRDHNFGNLAFLDSQAHALRLFAAIRDDHKDDGTRQVILSLAAQLAPSDFDMVLTELEKHRREIRHEGRWVNGMLQKRARAVA